MTKKDFYKTFRKNLRTLRLYSGMQATDLTRLLKLQEGRITVLETTDTTYPSVMELFTIAEHFGVDPIDMMKKTVTVQVEFK